MEDAHRAAISLAHTRRPSAALRAARKAGYISQAELAVALGVSTAFLSQVLSGKRRMPAPRAMAFEVLTGYPADRWA